MIIHTESLFAEINRRKTKWLLFATQCSLNQSEEHCLKNIGDYFCEKYSEAATERSSENMQLIHRRTLITEVSFATLLKPLLHRYSPVHWLHIFRTYFLKNTSGQLLLNTTHSCLLVMPIWRKRNEIYQNFFLIMMQKNLLKRKTCFKSHLNLGYIDLFIPNSVCSFQNTATVACG